ncbi:hypothetical protein BVC80_985g4 [Macleaya cordata]|uniref:Transposase MuDR plant domain-containing protein n=1 Tax=Macleaya cordata TaxID=56857 RepID=A0A200QA47_MACCD|nr:hypothetical protein BVC80_985g4 [Macleaya cordata]
MDVNVLGVFSFNHETFGERIRLNSTISGLKNKICEIWNVLTPLSIDLFFIRDGKRYSIETDSDLQSLACFTFAKGETSVQILVGRIEVVSNSVVCSEVSSCHSITSSSYEQQGEVTQPLLSATWADVFTHVGQIFGGGAKEFRMKVLQYSIESGYGIKLSKNEPKRVTVVCSKKEQLGCLFKVHACRKFNLPHLFMIKELNLNHTCGAGFRDTRRPPMSSRLVKCLMLKELMDNPSTKPKDIIKRFKTYYGVDLEYYFAYAGRNLAMTEIYGDAAKFYSKLVWYTEALKKSNPGSHVVLEVDTKTRQFQRLFVAFKACIDGFNYFCPMLYLDGTFLKGKFKGCLLAATGKNANQAAEVDSVFKSKDYLSFGSTYWFDLTSKNKSRDYLVTLFCNCVYASTLFEFDKAMDLFLEVGGSAVKKFLNGASSEHWANALFGGNREELALPITFSVDSIRVKIMNMMTERRELCRSWSSYLCPNMENILTEKINLGRSWKVTKSMPNFEMPIEVNDEDKIEPPACRPCPGRPSKKRKENIGVVKKKAHTSSGSKSYV